MWAWFSTIQKLKLFPQNITNFINVFNLLKIILLGFQLFLNQIQEQKEYQIILMRV